jgi:hypothetical protein
MLGFSPLAASTLSDLARKTEDWQLSYDCAIQALTIKDKALVYTMDPTVWGAKPHDLVALAAYHLGKRDEAAFHTQCYGQLSHNNRRQQ